MSSASSGRDLARLKTDRGLTICVCLPALNEEATISSICARIDTELRREVQLVDELIVIDCGSGDRTVERARNSGATVFQSAALGPNMSFGGKGEALWKSLSAINSSIVAWLDSDVSNFEAVWVVDLLRSLLEGQALMAKGSYRRSLGENGRLLDHGGGRVTELVARPLINALWPSLAHLKQPLAGETASFTSLLRQLHFLSGYAVELGLVVEFARHYGSDSIRNVDLGVRNHRNRSLEELGRMSFEIIHGAALLLEAEHRTPSLDLCGVLTQPRGSTATTHHIDIRRLTPRVALSDSFTTDDLAAAHL